MNTIGDRLKYVIEMQGDSVKKFCDSNGINYSGIINIINGERSLGVKILKQLKEVIPNLDANWLLFDESIQKEDISKYDIDNPVRIINENALGDQLVKQLLLKYLDDSDIQNRIKQILKS